MNVVASAPGPIQKKKKTEYGHTVLRSTNDIAYKDEFSMYVIPPTEEVTMDEFEEYSYARIQVLRDIENAKVSGHQEQEIDEVIRRSLQNNGLSNLNTSDAVRKDVISHFILRLAFCKPQDRNWFIKQESRLFKYRLKKPEYVTMILSYLNKNTSNVTFTPVPEDELAKIMAELNAVSFYRKATEKYYKVPFEEALSLVKQRKVLIKRGIAFVAESDFPSILVNVFKKHLNERLLETFKAFSNKLQDNESILPILTSISTHNVKADYKVDTKAIHGKVELNQIDMLSKRSFPMCMRNLHSKLRESHHLKHMGRMQYGLFLKGIGLNLQDALTFWRNEFTQIMGNDNFEKSYSYNIRHNYGKEGKRADYTPYSCIKIIMAHVGPGEHHGCPFRNFDGEYMRRNLASQGVANSGISEIIELVKGQHFQIACRKHFELTHPGCRTDLAINHPNQYFEESEKYYGSVVPGKAADTANANSNTTTTTTDSSSVPSEPKMDPVE